MILGEQCKAKDAHKIKNCQVVEAERLFFFLSFAEIKVIFFQGQLFL